MHDRRTNVVEGQSWVTPTGSVVEELDGLVQFERRYPIDRFPGDPQGFATRRENADLGGSGDELVHDVGDFFNQVLTRVEAEQE